MLSSLVETAFGRLGYTNNNRQRVVATHFQFFMNNIMKKGLIALLSAVVVLSGCNNAGQNSGKGDDNGSGSSITFDTLKVDEVFALDSIEKESPTLHIDINLLVPKTTDQAVAENMNNCIAYAAYGYENITPQIATDSIVKQIVGTYYEMRNDYFNEKNVNPGAPWFNAYYILRSAAGKGRGNTICYTVRSEVYEGGAHPYSIISAVNFDAASGKEIGLHDIFMEGCDSLLTERLTTRLAQQHNVASLQELKDIGFLTLNDMYVTNNFVTGEDSIFFIYNEYEIAPYALGSSCIGFNYNELKDILK